MHSMSIMIASATLMLILCICKANTIRYVRGVVVAMAMMVCRTSVRVFHVKHHHHRDKKNDL